MAKYINRGFLFLLLAFGGAQIVYASGAQEVYVTIDESLTARIEHKLPFDSNQFNEFHLSVPTEKGLNYKFEGASDIHGKIRFSEPQKNLIYVFPNVANEGIQDLSFSFSTLTEYVSDGMVMYNFTVYTEPDYLNYPVPVELTIPSSLLVWSTKPQYTSESPLQITYPTSKFNGLVKVNFIKSPLPTGVIKKEVGLFTLIGTQIQVAKLERIVKPLTFLPQMFTRVFGGFDVGKLTIVSTDFTKKVGKKVGVDVGGEAREPNIVVLDQRFSDWDDHAGRRVLIHEVAHLIENQKSFGGQEKKAGWFDEGIAEFSSLHAVDAYLYPQKYWVENNEKGELAVWQDSWSRFTPQELRAYYQHPFDILHGDPVSKDDIDHFYMHSALVFLNFYQLVGETGMREFIRRVDDLEPAPAACGTCDGDKILEIMREISGKQTSELLFPYRDEINLEEKVGKITWKPFTQKEIDAILELRQTGTKQNETNPTSTKNTATPNRTKTATSALDLYQRNDNHNDTKPSSSKNVVAPIRANVETSTMEIVSIKDVPIAGKKQSFIMRFFITVFNFFRFK